MRTTREGVPGMSVASAFPGRRRLPRNAHLALVTTHIAVSVGLLGDSAGFLAVAVSRANSDDGAFRSASRSILGQFGSGFGIPLSLLARATGVALAVATRRNLLRVPWVTAKLALILSVIVVDATLISPVIRPGAVVDDGGILIGAVWDVVALMAAVVLAV